MVVSGKLYCSFSVIHARKSLGYPLVLMLGVSQGQSRRCHKEKQCLFTPTGFLPTIPQPSRSYPSRYRQCQINVHFFYHILKCHPATSLKGNKDMIDEFASYFQQGCGRNLWVRCKIDVHSPARQATPRTSRVINHEPIVR